MSFKENNNEEKENSKINGNNNSIFKKVELQIRTNNSPEIKSKSKEKEKDKEIKLPYIQLNQEIKGRKMSHVQNFCNSIYSIYSNNYLLNSKNNKTIDNIYNIRENMDDILNDSKLKAIEDIKHYFFINKFPNEVNFRRNNLKELYKKINTTPAKIKPLSLKKLNHKINHEEKFTLITTLNIKQEKKEEKEHKICESIDSYSQRNKKYNFEDYANNNIRMKHPILYQLNFNKNKKNKLPGIHKRNNKIFNDIVEISKLIPDKTEINKENKIINYDEYMRMKELKIFK